MYRTILVPLDGSPRAERILPHVEEIERLTQEAKTYLNALQERLRTKGIEAKTLVEYGPVVPTLLTIAKREDAGLIVLASHGRTGLGRVFYGSVAAGLLNRIDRPLLVIRAQD
jgi:nucleotide-binding universal stress UspA family protein